MNGAKDKRLIRYIIASFGLLTVIWLSILIAPTIDGGLPQMLPKLGSVFSVCHGVIVHCHVSVYSSEFMPWLL